MSINLSKLQNVKTVAGKTTARCPACAAAGGDSKGDHLVIYPNGGYGRVANPNDKAHVKEIFRLAGVAGGGGGNGKITVRGVNVPASKVLMDLKGFDRFKVAPIPRLRQPAPAEAPEAPTEKPPADEVRSGPTPMDPAGPMSVDKGRAADERERPSPADWVDLDGKTADGVPANRPVDGAPLWKFLGVTEEAFHSTGGKTVETEGVC